MRQTHNRFVNRTLIGLALATMMALSTACQNQTPTPGAQARFGNTGARGAAPTALPTREVAPITAVAVDGVLALAGPEISAAYVASGNVVEVHVTPGQEVKKGDLLAELDDTDLQTALRQAQQSLALQQAQVDNSLAPAKKTDIDSAKAALSSAYAAYHALKQGPDPNDVDIALRSWNQAKNSLYSAQVSRDVTCGFLAPYNSPDKIKLAMGEPDCKRADLSVQASENSLATAKQAYLDAQAPPTADKVAAAWSAVVQAQTSLATLQNGVSDAQKQVYNVQLAQAQVTVDRARRDLAQAKLLSPCACVVQGVTLVAGSASANGSVTLLDRTQLQFRTTNLGERDVVNVHAGQAVTIRLKAFDHTFSGKVNAIMPVSSGVLGTVALFTVIIDIDSTDTALLPGMTGQAEISLK